MKEEIFPAGRENHSPESTDPFSHYLSLRFYRTNLENLKDKTKDSINNFLKTISEMEDEFAGILQGQQPSDPDPNDYGFESSMAYMEENY